MSRFSKLKQLTQGTIKAFEGETPEEKRKRRERERKEEKKRKKREPLSKHLGKRFQKLMERY
jgi:hypothetical protein